MITAVDTNVLIDCVESVPASIDALEFALSAGSLIASPIVYSELCAGSTGEEVDRFFENLGVELVPFGRDSLRGAGETWARYIQSGGSRQKRILPDFLIGSHAREHAERLLTRDREFYREYFQDLTVMEPEST